MSPANIAVGEVSPDRGPVVFKLLTECVPQPRETANLHPHCEILAFDNRSADTLGIRVSDNWDHLRARDFSGAVPRFATLRSRVDLDKSGEVNAVT